MLPAAIGVAALIAKLAPVLLGAAKVAGPAIAGGIMGSKAGQQQQPMPPPQPPPGPLQQAAEQFRTPPFNPNTDGASQAAGAAKSAGNSVLDQFRTPPFNPQAGSGVPASTGASQPPPPTAWDRGIQLAQTGAQVMSAARSGGGQQMPMPPPQMMQPAPMEPMQTPENPAAAALEEQRRKMFQPINTAF